MQNRLDAPWRIHRENVLDVNSSYMTYWWVLKDIYLPFISTKENEKNFLSAPKKENKHWKDENVRTQDRKTESESF